MKPVKIHIYSKSGEIINTYIFVGDVSKDIRTCIESAQKSISSSCSTKLKKHYGIKWKELLNISSKSGGAPNYVEGCTAGGSFESKEDQDDEITLEELNAISNIKQDVAVEVYEEIPAVSETPMYDTTKNKNVYVFDLILYPHDNILEFKKKVALITGIPIYKQHIWYEYSKKRFNMNYNLYLQEKAIQISFVKSIFAENKNIEKIEDIPILMDFYNAKKLLSIKAFDTFTILENISVDLGIVEFNLVNLDDFVDPNILHKLDKTSVDIVYYGFVVLFWPMFSYSAWLDYVHNLNTFEKMYPDLGINKEANEKTYRLEQKITEEASALFTEKDKKKEKESIEHDLYIGLTYSAIQVTSLYIDPILNLRNLFDKIELNDSIISCKCSTLYKGQKIIFNKTYKSNPVITTPIPLRCLLLRIKIDITTLDVYFYPDGNFTIKSKWPEEQLYDFEMVFEKVSRHITPIIEKINKFDNYVLKSNSAISKITKKNSKFSEVYVSLIYRKSVKFQEFKALEEILRELSDGKIISFNQINHVDNSIQYYFLKGMHKSDSARIEKNFILENYYEFLTNAAIKNKWQQLFVFTRNTTFQYRHGDIKISIEGIKESEFLIFYMYIVYALFKMKNQSKHTISSKLDTIVQPKKNVKSLKTQDPILYDFKKLYNSPIIYSKICQKPYQPVILNNDEYSSLEKKDKNRTVKYWNFTTNTDTYYFCPNTRYPYIQFTIKKHPKDYCIPCCKKKPITENDNKIKQAIFNACLTEHKYVKEKINLIQDTRYIMNYGKYISPGRICNLPENSIEPLLYENFSENTSGIEPQCEEQNRYYIYGIEQHSENVKHVGYINSLAFSLDISLRDLVNKVLQHIKRDPSKFKTLLDGQIIKYFYSAKDLISNIQEAFFQSLYTKDIPWNELFIELAYHYLNILTIVFVDKTNQYENVKLLINGKISNPDQILNTNYQTTLVVKKDQNYNPIYYLNSIVFFRTKLITSKLYNSSDNILQIIQKVVIFDEINKYNTSSKKADVTLSVINNFIDSSTNKEYSILAYFINNDNLCYYIKLRSKKSNSIFYIPVKFSTYISNVELIYDCYFSHKFKTQLKILNQFIRDFNHWIAVESETKGYILEGASKDKPLEQRVNPIYDFIRIDKWLLLSNPYASKTTKIIGFKHNNINYYHETISEDVAKKLSNSPFEQLLYHPDEVNAVLYKAAPPKPDNRIKNITTSIYNYHLYELFILEFIELFNKEKNIQLRHNIKKTILQKIDSNSIETINKISEIIAGYFADFPNEPENSKADDILRITEQINLFIVKHHDKKLLLDHIDLSFYNFDRVKINYLKTFAKNDIVKELKTIAKRIVIIVPENSISKLLSYKEEFPNMLVSCQNKQSNNNIYCKQNKLIITAKKLDELVEILAADILNPFKQKWLFNIVFSDKIVNYFKFARHANETITVETQ